MRLAECNLRCGWCDTEYSWNWEKHDRQKEAMGLSVEQVLEKVRHYPCRHLVITGGEPLLQQRELILLMTALEPEGYRFEVETNATVVPTGGFDRLIDQYNCSPKLKNSGHQKREREKSKALKFFADSPKAFFKFVIATPACQSEVEALVTRYSIPKERVCLMPEGKTQEAVLGKMRWLAPLCMERGFKLTDRLHLHLFGAKRGT